MIPGDGQAFLFIYEPGCIPCPSFWKKDIFLSKNSHLVRQYNNSKSESVRKSIQRWLDDEGVYPKLDSDEEYSFYAQEAHPIEGDRQRYFQRLI